MTRIAISGHTRITIQLHPGYPLTVSSRAGADVKAMLISGTLRWQLRRCAAIAGRHPVTFGMPEYDHVAVHNYARWYVMIRVAVRQRPCPDRDRWSVSIPRMSVWEAQFDTLTGRICRTMTDVLLTGELSGPGFLMSNALTSLRRDTATPPVSRSAYSGTSGRKGMGNASK